MANLIDLILMVCLVGFTQASAINGISDGSKDYMYRQGPSRYDYGAYDVNYGQYGDYEEREHIVGPGYDSPANGRQKSDAHRDGSSDYMGRYNYDASAKIDPKEGYGQTPSKTKYVPVVVKKKKKKQKIITIQKGVFIPGGSQVFGKFKSLKSCMKACGAMPGCFAGDYNPWLGKCYFHGNGTACHTMRSHAKITHFKKVPCAITDAPRGLIVLGASLHHGTRQKGIDDLSTCIKKCTTAGGGVAATSALLGADFPFDHHQICFAIDYDFATHSCWFHTQLFTRPAGVGMMYFGAPLCPTNPTLPVTANVDLRPNPSSIHMVFCPVL